MSEDRAPLNQPRPGPAGTIAFMIGAFPIRLVQFIVTIVGLTVGVATTIIWVGIPILMVTTSLIRGFADIDRRLSRKLLRTPVPLPDVFR